MLCETGTVPLSHDRRVLIRDHLGLTPLEDIVVGGWDVTPASLLETTRASGVVPESMIQAIAPELAEVRAMPAVFSSDFVKKVDGEHVIRGRTLLEDAERIRQNIAEFKRRHQTDRLVIVNVGSTEKTGTLENSAVLNDPEAFVRGLRENHPAISPAMIYFYAAIQERVPHVNFTPSQAEVPALRALAAERKVLYAGKDGKTGQTLIKTVLAPAFKARQLKVDGWFSTNILGNGDGRVLSNPESLSSKLRTKESALDDILGYRVGSNYDVSSHVVTIHYYPPRGDAKESWDSIDVEGFLGMPMQMKVNFLCRDSILAAPLVVDLARLIRHGAESGHSGIFRPLASFFKAPLHDENERPIHDFFLQRALLADYITGRSGSELIEIG
jgi:myo-inositol-1-phosphate synthase